MRQLTTARGAFPGLRAAAGALLPLALALAVAGNAAAQSTGSWIVQLGGAHSNPVVDSGTLSGPSVSDTKTGVTSDSTAIASIVYGIDDNFSLAFYGGIPFRHDLTGAGSAEGIGKLASVKVASPALMLQYRLFTPADAVRPYAGIGYTYASIYDEKGTSALTAVTNPGGTPTHLNVDSASGGIVQLGGSFEFSDRWTIDASILKVFIKTTAHMSTGQRIDVRLDPVLTTLSLGYRF